MLIASDTYLAKGIEFNGPLAVVQPADLIPVMPSSGTNVAVNQIDPTQASGRFFQDVQSISVYVGTSLSTVQTITLTAFAADFAILGQDSFTGGFAQTLSVQANPIRFFTITSTGNFGFGFDDLSFAPSMVPVPASLPLLGGAGLMLIALRRRKGQTSRKQR